MPQKRIFVSHIHEDEYVANALAGTLRFSFEQIDLSVFVSSDPTQIRVGDNWLDVLRSRIGDADAVFILLSPEAIVRPWVNFEAGAAWLAQKLVIPVCIGGLDPGRLPKPYGDIQAIDLEAGKPLMRTFPLRHLLQSVWEHFGSIGKPPYDLSIENSFYDQLNRWKASRLNKSKR